MSEVASERAGPTIRRADLTLRQLYGFCHDNSLDLEIYLKSDGRGILRFFRWVDDARFGADFDFEHRDEHLPERVLAALEITPVREDAERVRLETPR